MAVSKKKIFIDSDVILDLMITDRGFQNQAIVLFNAFSEKRYEVFTSSLVMANVFYVANKKRKKSEIVSVFKKLRSFLNILPVSQKAFDKSLVSDFKDFEDALQHFAALENKISTIITRNKKDFSKSQIQVMSPSEFIKSENL